MDITDRNSLFRTSKVRIYNKVRTDEKKLKKESLFSMNNDGYVNDDAAYRKK